MADQGAPQVILRRGPEGGRLLCLWPSTVEAAFFG
jgi:hypothetical protein